jgi:hypothetical protein
MPLGRSGRASSTGRTDGARYACENGRHRQTVENSTFTNGVTYFKCGQTYYMQAYGSGGPVFMPVPPPRVDGPPLSYPLD